MSSLPYVKHFMELVQTQVQNQKIPLYVDMVCLSTLLVVDILPRINSWDSRVTEKRLSDLNQKGLLSSLLTDDAPPVLWIQTASN